MGRANYEKSRKNIALLPMSAGECRGGIDGQRLAGLQWTPGIGAMIIERHPAATS
jgi:hypothetical protein